MALSLFEREVDSLLQTYKRLPIIIDHAEGCKVYSQDGKEYIDFLAGIAVNLLGHSHPRILEAVTNQMKKYMHVSNYFYQEPQILLAEKLQKITDYGKCFFANSGTEVLEGAFKLTRRCGSLRNKTEVLGLSGGFHGRTYAALSIMDKPHYKSAMGPFLQKAKVIEYNNEAQLRASIDWRTAAVFIEFLQGEGGIIAADKSYIEALFELKDKYKFLVIADEIQSGVGRTGKFFSFEHYGVKPDIVLLAKGIGGGLPLGVILTMDHLRSVWEKGMHGTTFGGNPVSCAAGLVVLEEVEKSLMKNAQKTGDYFKKRLDAIRKEFPSQVVEVRGKGLMLGLLLSFDAEKLQKSLLEKGLITITAQGNVLRLIPSLTISKVEIDLLSDTLKKIFSEEIFV